MCDCKSFVVLLEDREKCSERVRKLDEKVVGIQRVNDLVVANLLKLLIAVLVGEAVEALCPGSDAVSLT